MQKGFQHCLPVQFNEEEGNNLNKTKTSIYKTVLSLSFPVALSPSTRLQWGSTSMVHPGVVWPHFHQHQSGVCHQIHKQCEAGEDAQDVGGHHQK